MRDTALPHGRPDAASRPIRPATGRRDPVARIRPAIAGLVGALTGIGLSELVAGFIGAP
jgi:hypothetical protein